MITPYVLEQAQDRLETTIAGRDWLEVHTVTIVLTDNTPVLTITGTDDDLDDHSFVFNLG